MSEILSPERVAEVRARASGTSAELGINLPRKLVSDLCDTVYFHRRVLLESGKVIDAARAIEEWMQEHKEALITGEQYELAAQWRDRQHPLTIALRDYDAARAALKGMKI